MTLRRLLPLVALAALAALLLLLFLSDEPAAGPAGDGPAAAETGADAAPGELTRADTGAAAAAAAEPLDPRGEKIGLGDYGLHGTVVDEHGDPVPHAWVGAFSSPYPLFDYEQALDEILERPLAFDLEPNAAARADAAGKFRLEGLFGRSTYLVARAPKRLTRGRQLVKPEELLAPEGVLLHTVAGAELRGVVVDEFNAPVANAEVFVTPSLMYVVQAVRTGEIYVERLHAGGDGAFALEAVPAGIVLAAQGFDGVTHPGAADVGPLAAGATGEIRIRLAETGSLTARIVDEEQQPVRGAKAVAVPLDFRLAPAFVRDLPAWIVDSGADGAVRWPRLPRRNYLLLAQARDGRTAPYAAAVAGAGSVAPEPLVVQKRQSVTGRLVDAQGAGIGGARVMLASIPSKPGAEEENAFENGVPDAARIFLEIGKEALPLILPSDTWSQTDGSGRFLLPAWPRARLAVEVAGHPKTSFELPELEDGQRPVLVLAPPGAIEGRVQGLDGQPVRFFAVNADLRRSFLEPEPPELERLEGEDGRAFRMRRQEAEAEARRSVLGDKLAEGEVVVLPEETRFGELLNTRMMDDGTGRFRIENLMPGQYVVEARASGFPVGRSDRLDVPPGGVVPDVTISLARGATIRGRVVAAGTREPVSGALVWAGEGDESGITGMLFAASEVMALDRSGADGAFELTGVENGADRIHATAEGYAPAMIKGRPLAEGDVREDLIVEMKAGGTIQGDVTDRHGRPVPARMVAGFSTDSQDFWQAPTDVTGFYKASNVKPGNYFILTAALDDEALFTGNLLSVLGGSRMAQAFVKDGQTVTVDIVDAGAGGCKVRGRILLAGGEPVRLASMFAMAAESSLLDLRMATARSDAEGWFLFKSLAPGTYQLQVQGADWEGSLEMVVPDLPEAELLLTAPDGSVSGLVVSAQTGLPASGVSVTLTREDSALGFLGSFMPGGRQSERETTDEDGRFRFGGVAEGRYSVEVRANGFFYFEGEDEGPAEEPLGRLAVPAFTLRLNENRDLGTLRLPIASALVVRVTSGGEPLENGFSIRVEPAGGAEGETEESWGWNGRGRISGLEPGEYDVVVSSQGYASKRTRGVLVPASQTAEVLVELVPGVALAARVLDQNGQPLPEATIEVLDGSGLPAEGLGGRERALGYFGEEGAMPLGSFEPGAYRVRVSFGGRTQEQGVSLSSAQEETTIVEFTFPR